MAKSDRLRDVGVPPVTERQFLTRPKYLLPCKQAEGDARSQGCEGATASPVIPESPSWMKVCRVHMDVKERPSKRYLESITKHSIN